METKSDLRSTIGYAELKVYDFRLIDKMQKDLFYWTKRLKVKQKTWLAEDLSNRLAEDQSGS